MLCGDTVPLKKSIDYVFFYFSVTLELWKMSVMITKYNSRLNMATVIMKLTRRKDVIKQDVSYATKYYGPCHLTIIASYRINVVTCETNK